MNLLLLMGFFPNVADVYHVIIPYMSRESYSFLSFVIYLFFLNFMIVSLHTAQFLTVRGYFMLVKMSLGLFFFKSVYLMRFLKFLCIKLLYIFPNNENTTHIVIRQLPLVGRGGVVEKVLALQLLGPAVGKILTAPFSNGWGVWRGTPIPCPSRSCVGREGHGHLVYKYTWSVGCCITWCNLLVPLFCHSLVAFKPRAGHSGIYTKE